jgi:GT2 family glycosyltransferase
VSFVASEPKVSVIIPSKNASALIQTVVKGLLEETNYGNKEVIIVDNGSDDPRVLEFYRALASRRSDVIIDRFQGDFSFAHSVNRGLRRASGEHFLLLNNDISVIHPDWLTEMVSCLSFDRAGIVGAKLLYPNATLQHAGVVAGFGGLAGHWYLGKPADFGGPMNRLHVRSSMTCVTGAAMLISGECRQAVGDMDEGHFPVAYNDVDYCLRAHKQGFRVVWTPFASLYHHESASRGTDATVKNRLRFEREKSHLRKLHATETFLDPAASPHFARNSSDPPLGRLQILPRPRRWHDASLG